MRAEGAGSKVTCGPSRREAASPWPLAFPPNNGSWAGRSGPNSRVCPENRLQRPARAQPRPGGQEQTASREDKGGWQQARPPLQVELSGCQSSHQEAFAAPAPWLGGAPSSRKPGAERLRRGDPRTGPPSMKSWRLHVPASEWAGAQSCQQGRSPRSWGGCTSRSGRCPAGS